MTESNKLMLTGTHGTSRTRADQILKTGFRGKGIGRHGRGVYLWSSHDKDNHADGIMLAASYAIDRGKNGDYRGDNDDSAKVLLCDIVTQQTRYTDISSAEINLLYKSYVRKMESFLKDEKQGKPKERSCQVTDAFIATIEKIRQETQEVVFIHTVAPTSYRNKLGSAAKMAGMDRAGCYVVRDIKCISNIDYV